MCSYCVRICQINYFSRRTERIEMISDEIEFGI